MKTSNVKTKRSVLAMILCTAVAFGGMIHDVPAKAEDNSTAVKWVRGVNDWGFFNLLQHLGEDYYLREEDKTLLWQNFKNTEKFGAEKVLNLHGVGRCYGIAVTSVLSCYGLIPYESYALNPDAVPKSINDVGFPYVSETASRDDADVPPAVRSLLSVYSLMQLKDCQRQESARLMYQYTEQERIQMLLERMEQEIPTVIGISFSGNDPEQGRPSHALVAYGVEDCEKRWENKTYDKKILIADPNMPYKTVNPDALPAVKIHGCLYVNTKDWSWYLSYYGKSDNGDNITQILSDPDVLNWGGILHGTKEPAAQEPFIGVLSTNRLKGDYQLKKAVRNGNTVTAQGDADFKQYEAFYPDAVESAVLNFLTKDIDDAYALQLEEPQPVEMLMNYENSIQRVQSEKMKEASVSPSGYAGFKGGTSAYSLEIITNENYPTPWYDVRVDGIADAASLTMQDHGYLLTAKNDGRLEVTVKNDTQTIACCYMMDADSVLLYEETDGELAAAADLDGNGTFETVLTEYFASGDVNLDGSINAKDATEILIAAAKAGTGQDIGLTDVRQKAADVNSDGSINAMDANWILRYSAAVGTGSVNGSLDEFVKRGK